MKHSTALLVATTGLAVSVACTRSEPISYPEAPPGDVVETLHGVEVADPYRWLEDLDSAETSAWVEAQQALTDAWLEGVFEREAYAERLTELWDFRRVGVPVRAGDRIVYEANDGLQNQDVLYVADDLDATPEVLLDPNTLSDDGTVSLTAFRVSPDGRNLAYGLSSGGSDWRQWRIRELASGEDLPDTIRWVKFNVPSWAQDGSGLFYARYPEPTAGDELEETTRDHSVWFHRLGTVPTDDRLVFEPPAGAGWILGTATTFDGREIVVTGLRGRDRTSSIFVGPVAGGPDDFVAMRHGFEALHRFVGGGDGRYWVHTDHEAPRGRVVALSSAAGAWVDLLPESEGVLEAVTLIGDRVVAEVLRDASSHLVAVALDGSRTDEVDLDLIGTVTGQLSGDHQRPIGYFGLQSFTTPTRVYRLDVDRAVATLAHAPSIAFDPEELVVRQVFYPSADGTRVPMFMAHRRGLEPGGDHPVILHGYGGFNSAQTPRYRAWAIAWMERGGIWATANLRGGGEYGRQWHDAGRLKNKQNVFDDFIAAGEWLISEGWTSSDRLALYGGSNGGLLVAAVVNQRPDLAAAAVPVVGVMDMLRFHRFTIGWAWVSDYGSPDDPEMFEVLRAYSPYHNIEPGTRYPAVLAMTADHDDRVVPSHTFKYVARLQTAQAGDAPILARIESRAGHGAGTPVSKRIAEGADILAFLTEALAIGG